MCERSRWRWVYNHGTVVAFIIISLLFLLLIRVERVEQEQIEGKDAKVLWKGRGEVQLITLSITHSKTADH